MEVSGRFKAIPDASSIHCFLSNRFLQQRCIKGVARRDVADRHDWVVLRSADRKDAIIATI
jgi:hypothetical protein